MYISHKHEVWFDHRTNERDVRAVCKTPADAQYAVAMLNKAITLNDKRKYTAAARLIAEVEAMNGFKWIEV